MKIAFAGVPCSGKTTTARELAKRLDGVYIPEIARVLIQSQGRPPTKEDQDFIMRMQATLEDSMFGKLVVCDVPIFINHIYYRFYWGYDKNCRKLYEIAKKHKYDIIFKLSPLPYTEDGVRYQTKVEIKEIDRMMDDYEADFGKMVHIEPTDLKERMELIIKEIYAHEIRS